ncbi:MAG: FAD-binding oxidoreductase [Desulfobacterales bacterium]|nr:MAG: FAD-binding oxidoreductase [Desulfobacterales bacterium]
MHPEVIIIGGGVIGTACAYFLAQRGVKVLVLERNHLGCGASGSTAAIISISGSGSTLEPLRPLSLESYRLFSDHEQNFDPALEIIRGGALYAAMDAQEAVAIRPFYDEIRQMGIDCRLLDGKEALDFEPLLAPQVTAAVFNPASFHVNPFRLGEAYLNAALRQGGRVAYGVKVQDIVVANDRVVKVVTNRGDYQGDWVVVAAGAHTPQLLSPLGLPIPIVPARGQVILTEACPRMTDRVLLFVDHLYARQTASGNFYLGSHTEFVGFDNRITLQKLTTFARAFTRAIPLLARVRALRFFAGFRPICEDNLPVIGPLPGCSKLVVASGHGRTGVRFSASTGKAVSELIVDGQTEQPMEAFSPRRFAENVAV